VGVVKPGPYRDGTVHVLSERCSTCVFRPGNLMSLHEGRLADLVEANRAADSALTCHQTLPYSGTGAEPAVCRGYYDAYADDVTPLRFARILNLIIEDPPPKEET
jgi:hypothetical protein